MQINVFVIDTKLAEKGMNRKSLAEVSGICPQSISTILNRGTCNSRTAGKLATALNISAEEIICK